MPPQAPAWLLLVTNLPGRNPTLRMRIWRALKASGAGLLRDGAYLLPNGEHSRQVLEEQGAEIKAAGGLVQVLSFDAESDQQNAELVALFDRSGEYAEAIQRLTRLKSELPKLGEPEARQRLAAPLGSDRARPGDAATSRSQRPAPCPTRARTRMPPDSRR